jgi:hypothetical protein
LLRSDWSLGAIEVAGVRREATKVKSDSRAARVAPEGPDHTGLPRGFPLWLADVEAGMADIPTTPDEDAAHFTRLAGRRRRLPRSAVGSAVQAMLA